MDSWRQFELLVSRIEQALSPKGAVVRSPDRIADLITGQPREVDASIRMQVGSAPVLITVECRDRIAVQDDTWIEQLAKKKEKIGASATIAVSANGFTEPAKISASHFGIQLRTLTDASADTRAWANGIDVNVEFREWRFTRIQLALKNAPPTISLSRLQQEIEADGYEAAIAFGKSDNAHLILMDIGSHFVQHGTYPPLPGVRPYGRISPTSDHYVSTDQGAFLLDYVELEVEITSIIEPVPLRQLFDYADLAGPLYRVADYTFESSSGALHIGVVTKQ